MLFVIKNKTAGAKNHRRSVIKQTQHSAAWRRKSEEKHGERSARSKYIGGESSLA